MDRIGNVPSAKFTTLREAATYLAALPPQVVKIITIRRRPHPARGETLARYFCRLNAHLLGSIVILEVDETTRDIDELHGSLT